MRSFLRFITKYPNVTVLVIVAIGLIGIYSAMHMSVDLFPNLEVPVVNIITHYPGAAPEDIELLISRPIEDEMRSIPGVKRVASTSVKAFRRLRWNLPGAPPFLMPANLCKQGWRMYKGCFLPPLLPS